MIIKCENYININDIIIKCKNAISVRIIEMVRSNISERDSLHAKTTCR